MSQSTARFALSVTLLSGLSAGATLTATPGKAACVKNSEAMITAEGVAFDAPGGTRIGSLSPQAKYARITTLRHTDGKSWILLAGPGGAHVGWIMASAVRYTHLGAISCGMDDLYKRPQ